MVIMVNMLSSNLARFCGWGGGHKSCMEPAGGHPSATNQAPGNTPGRRTYELFANPSTRMKKRTFDKVLATQTPLGVPPGLMSDSRATFSRK